MVLEHKPHTPVDEAFEASPAGSLNEERLRATGAGVAVRRACTRCKIAKARHPGLPVFLLGHSAGGVMSAIYLLDNAPELAKFICGSFAFQVPAPGFALAAIKGLSHIAPRLPVLKLRNEDFSRDPKAVAALSDDPLTAHEV
jgi:acylglycerol lipase